MKRRSAGRRLRFEDTLAAAATSNDVPRDGLRTLVAKDEVRRALEQVPADQRQALLLHHVEGWSFVEIAARLGIRVNAAKTRAFPLRPGVAGALYGLGCGLIADAGLRLYCEYPAPQHVVFAHGGAILGAMFAGVLVAWISAPRQA